MVKLAYTAVAAALLVLGSFSASTAYAGNGKGNHHGSSHHKSHHNSNHQFKHNSHSHNNHSHHNHHFPHQHHFPHHNFHGHVHTVPVVPWWVTDKEWWLRQQVKPMGKF